jgi:hypothetical protein
VRRWLEEHGYRKSIGGQYTFDDETCDKIIARMNTAHDLYQKHVRRFEKSYNGKQRLPLYDF